MVRDGGRRRRWLGMEEEEEMVRDGGRGDCQRRRTWRRWLGTEEMVRDGGDG